MFFHQTLSTHLNSCAFSWLHRFLGPELPIPYIAAGVLYFYPTPEAKSGFQDVVIQRLQYITVLDWVSDLLEVFIFLFTFFFINSCFILGIETKNQILLLKLLSLKLQILLLCILKEHIVNLLRYYNDHYRKIIILE